MVRYSVLGMAQVTENGSGGRVATRDRAAALIDEIRRHEKSLCTYRARRAQLMLDFADVRRGLDQQRIGEHQATGGDARYTAGEFAVTDQPGLAKTHAGHRTSRPSPHTTTWTTPTGHTCASTDPPLPVEPLPFEPPSAAGPYRKSVYETL